jgi:hypothetical protein
LLDILGANVSLGATGLGVAANPPSGATTPALPNERDRSSNAKRLFEAVGAGTARRTLDSGVNGADGGESTATGIAGAGAAAGAPGGAVADVAGSSAEVIFPLDAQVSAMANR